MANVQNRHESNIYELNEEEQPFWFDLRISSSSNAQMKYLALVAISLFISSCGGASDSSAETSEELSSTQVQQTGNVMASLNVVSNSTSGYEVVQEAKRQAYLRAGLYAEATQFEKQSAAEGDSLPSGCQSSSSTPSAGVTRTTVTCSNIDSQSYSCGSETYSLSEFDLLVILEGRNIDIDDEGLSGQVFISVDISGTVDGGSLASAALECKTETLYQLSDFSSLANFELSDCDCSLGGETIGCSDLQTEIDEAACFE